MRSVGAVAAGRVLAVIAAIVVVAACGTPVRHGTGRAAAARSAAAHRPGGVSRGLRGELAFIAHSQLFLLGGQAGQLRRVALPGIAFAPAWSADHRWLAVEVGKPPPSGMPYLQEPSSLWLVNAAGTQTRRLTPASWDITGFAWSPRTPWLTVAVYLAGARQSRSGAVATVTPAGRRTILAVGSHVSGVAWSPDGQQIATGLATFSPPRRASWQGRLELLSPAGGRPRMAAASIGNVLELASWWPDGSGLLYWTDPQGSASIAADGLPLSSVSLPTGRPAPLAGSMLVHRAWLAFSPDGHTAAVVTGGDRVIWSGSKHILLCQQTGRCAAVSQPRGVVSLDPSWSPDGKAVVFAQLSAAGPFSPQGHADFSPYWIRRWEATSRLWTATGSGQSRPLAAAGPGAVDPVWGSDGSILFVRDDQVWLLPAGGRAPARVTGPLGALTGLAYQQTYYAYVPYPQLIAWTMARPTGTADAS